MVSITSIGIFQWCSCLFYWASSIVIRTLSECAKGIYIGHIQRAPWSKESDQFEVSEQEDSYAQQIKAQIKAQTFNTEMQTQPLWKTKEMSYHS